MAFIHDDFLLGSASAKHWYHDFAEAEPILDYHNHLPPKDLAEDRQFANLFEIWLEGDHYKWRAMRCNGEPEEAVTGSASPYEKFLAYARTVPHTLRNPLYHWTHLELKRYFGIDTLLGPDSAQRIWDETREKLASPEFSARNLTRKFKVRALCTTDDPVDDLRWHQQCRQDGYEVGVYPTFRPDKALAVHQPEAWNAWCDRLAAASGISINSFDRLLEALTQRHDFFHAMGGRLSDHGLNHCHANFVDQETLDEIFTNARAGQAASPEEQDAFASHIMLHIGRLNAEKGWTMQLHLGPLRNNNTRLATKVGADVGCDSIGDYLQGVPLSRFLDRLDQEDRLPKTVLYNVNPSDNYLFGTMAGNFADGSMPGKVQFGSGWWFVDQKEGMEWQINALSNLGLLSRFIGMLTDSRSFMSFPRHEYFRRTLCNLIGADVEAGLLPNDDALVGSMIRNICYKNVHQYLGLDCPTE
jgi:glucuronate isomerase